MGPLKDYVNSAWKLTTERFRQCYRVVIKLHCRMKMDGKDVALKDKSGAFKKVGIEYHRLFYESLENIGDIEEGRRRCEKL